MHDYNTIIGVIGLRRQKVSYPVIHQRYGIGNSGIDLIMNRFKDSGLSWDDLLKMEPSQVEELIYPPKNIRKDVIPLKPVLSLHSHVVYVKEVKKGQSISYGGTFTADRTMRVATIPVGYGD